MYPRILKNLLKTSTKIKSERTLKTTTLIFSNVVLSKEKKLPCVITPYFCTRYYSVDSDKDQFKVLPIGPTERKNYIDNKAQEQVDEILKNNPEMEKFMKVIELEISVRRQDGERVPSKLRPRDWVELLKLRGSMQRKKFLNYLFIIEKQQEKDKALQMEKNLELEQVRENRKLTPHEETDEIIYGIAHNSLFRRIQDSTMSNAWNWNAIKASMFGNKIVFDFGYEEMMNMREMKSCAKQILECHAINRQHNFPFDIYLCNVNFNGELIERLNRFMPTLFEDDFPINITSKSYLDVFDKSNVVYLSSDAPKDLEVYDPHMVYIIGALVDRGDKSKVSLAKAKKENLQMYRLPLDVYSKFGQGSGKDLTLNQVFAIMLDAQENDWKKAMSHLPQRKLYENRLRALEKKVQNQIYFSRSQAGEKAAVPLEQKLNFENDMPEFTSVSKLILNQKKSYSRDRDNMNNRETRNNFRDNMRETKNRFQSSEVSDFSNAARAKLKKQWSE